MANGRGADPYIEATDEEIGPQPWPEPEPLAEPAEKEQPYPLHALPRLISNAIAEYQQYGQQPTSLIAGSALSAASLAVQGQVDVARDDRLVGPSSIFTTVVAISGERKTSCDAEFRKPLREWLVAARERRLSDTEEAHAKVKSWEAAVEGVLGKIKKHSGNGVSGQADIEALNKELSELHRNKPDEAILPHLFYEDVNPESLALSLAEGWPSASLWSDESGLVIGSLGMSEDSAMRFMGLLNRLWDGGDFERTRTTARSAMLRGRRFSCCTLMQPVVLAKLLALGDGSSRKMGLIARYLPAWPASTMGTRRYRSPPAYMPAKEQFHARLRELLDRDLPIVPNSRMILKPPALRLTENAFQIWREFHDATEAALGRRGTYAEIPDIAAKMPENAARLAALFHVVDTGDVRERIAEPHMEAAVETASWYLNEARRIIAATEKPQAIVNAEALLAWLIDQHTPLIKENDILRLGPPGTRERKRRDVALELLVDRGCIREERYERVFYVALNPKLNGSFG